MRIAAFITASIATPLLVVGCSQETGGQARSTQPTPPTSGSSSSTTSTSAAQTQAAPPADTPIADVIAWVESGAPADPAGYHMALRSGVSVDLTDDIAFTTPAGTTCMTDAKHNAPALACLVELKNPPLRPADTYGQWKGGWVDFDGATISVGSAHGDPGRFSNGQGPQLPDGAALSFGDYRCRGDATALICVNYARHSAVRMAAIGIDAYACARQVNPPVGIGIQFAC